MRKTLAVVIVGALAVTGAAAAALLWPRPTPPAYPCVSTSKEGWLTAVSEDLLVRVEWGGGADRLGLSSRAGKVEWFRLSEQEARATVLEALEPLSRRRHATAPAEVSLFVACDGRGEYWTGATAVGTSRYRDCLHPVGEARWGCVKRVFDEGRLVHTDEVPGAIADRLDAIATKHGVPAAPRSPPPVPGLAGPVIIE